MDNTRELLLATAEELVREQGLEALSIRSLATRANYGKSTVHEAVGGVNQLVAELRLRSYRDMVSACAGDDDPRPEDAEWRGGMYTRVSQWLLDNPNWAELCFVSQGVDERFSWSNPMARLLLGVLPPSLEQLTEGPDGILLAHTANEYGAAMLKTIIAVGDVDYGAEVMRSTFAAIRSCIEGLIELRSGASFTTLTPRQSETRLRPPARGQT